MKSRQQRQDGPSIVHGRAHRCAVKTPRGAWPRLRRADGLDRACDEPRMASVDGPQSSWRHLNPGMPAAGSETAGATGAPSIVVTIGQETRVFHAFVTSAPARLDAPTTVTLYASTLADVAGFAADELAVEPAMARTSARLVLVDTMELSWQRARCREGGHLLLPADAGLVGLTTLERWLWRRIYAAPGRCDEADHGTDPSA